MELFGRLESLRTDFTVCMQPSFAKDGEALRKFLQFDTKVNILRGNKAGKAPSSFILAVASLLDYKTTLLLPTPMAVSQLYASIAQQLAIWSWHSPEKMLEKLVLPLIGLTSSTTNVAV